jgi:hypothetical protein
VGAATTAEVITRLEYSSPGSNTYTIGAHDTHWMAVLVGGGGGGGTVRLNGGGQTGCAGSKGGDGYVLVLVRASA